MSIEAMKLALEWMEKVAVFTPDKYDPQGIAAAEALHAAIDQAQKQEPVAHWSDCAVHSEPAYPKGGCDCGGFAASPQRQPEQEPVAWMFQHEETGRMNYVSNDGMSTPELFLKMNRRYVFVCALYTSPPQRKPLTDEEILILNNPNWDKGGEEQLIAAPDEEIIDFARAIEAAHGIKENT